jgi:hypothetical protein
MSAGIKLMRLLGAVMLTLAVVPWLGMSPASADNVDGQKITLCHGTNAETNPYVLVRVSINSVFKENGHDTHEGPIFEPGMKDQQIVWGDIIPPFDYGDGQHYDGKNWTEAGQDVYNGGCDSEQVCPTVIDPEADPADECAEPTDTPTEDTVSPSEDTESPSESESSSVLPTRIGSSDDASVLGTKVGALAATGMGLPIGAAFGLSLALILAGGALLAVPSQIATGRRRRH